MIVFPNCKINLGLNIIRKRQDGFHELETVFYPLPIYDVLEGLPFSQSQFYYSGLPIPGHQESNLCVKAWSLIRKDFPGLPKLGVWLHKHIPIGSGLGGASSDAVHMLKLINELFDLGLTLDELFRYALQLGSDCPFFLYNLPCLAKGRGELLESIQLDLSHYSFLLVHPDIHIDSGWAFSQSSPAQPAASIQEILREPLTHWKSKLLNDFERPVLSQYPVLKKVKEKLYQAGALYASMTGSGSSFYGIFRKESIPSLSFDENFRTLFIP